MQYVAPEHSYTALEVALLKQLDLPKVEDYNFLKEYDVLNYIGITIEDAKLYVDCIIDEFPEFAEKVVNRTYGESLLKFCSLGKPSLFYSKALKSVLSAHAARYILSLIHI